MVFTHLPANVLLIARRLHADRSGSRSGCLLLRSALSQMDVPARSSYVMAVVTPDERAGGGERHHVPRSLAVGGSRDLRRLVAGLHDVRLAARHRRRLRSSTT